ncbi:hypothetical protein GOP47_0020039 [Adiantum capillus-veneris]|uniref:FCP1 homology domain-containing protein n=1 Tax=Adiantum capillus-veneris TaxID=13818 RepID=A0A9D4UC71_ADICA|nr:hypothetical protein GOP47_0020039 [Adiantum capillus-veneris]
MLPHVPPIDDDVCTLGAAVGTVVAWPIRELAKGQRTVSSGGKGSVPVTPRATSIASGAMPKPSVSKPSPKTLAAESTGVKKRSADQASEVIESKRVTRAHKEEDPRWEPPKKNGRIPLKKEGASTKKEVTKAKVVQKPVKANAVGTTQSEVSAPSKDKVPIAKYSSEEDDEREDAGDEDRGLFTITEKSTLKWDLLHDTLHRLQDTRKVPVPPVPLCRLLPHPAVRLVQDRVHNLALEFSRNGYVPHRARFMLSIRTPALDSVEVSHAIRKTWDPIWMQLNEEFEKQLHKSGWGDVKGKMLYTWDGNHRLRAWNAQIDTGNFALQFTKRSLSTIAVWKLANEGEVLTVVARLNRINDKGYIKTSFIDMLCMVRAMGTANMDTLLKGLDEDVPGWLQRELDAEMNKRGGLRRCWYKVPLIVLSQLLYPAKYTKALQSVSNKRNELATEEFTTHYRNAFYMADKKARKNTQRAFAIADPNLGEEWWRLLMDIDWSRRPKWLTDDRIYSLACADLPVDHHSNVLRALVSDDPTTLYPSLKSALNDHSVFRTWLRRETWWNRLVNEATRQYALLKKSCRLPENDTLETTIREWQSRYSGTLYEVECERLKGGLTSNKQKQKEGTNMAAKRAFYRWVRLMDWTDKVPVTKEWLNVKHTACMYTEEQRAALWPKKVYVECPLFIDFAKDTFPPNEREKFKEAETDRVKRQQEEGSSAKKGKGQVLDRDTPMPLNKVEPEQAPPASHSISEPHVLPSHDEAHDQAQRQCTEIGINIEPSHLHRQVTTESEGLQDAIRSNEMATIIGLPHDANVTITEVSTGLSIVAETGHRGEPALLVGDVMVQCNTPPHDEAQNSMAHSSDSAVLAIDPMGAADETGKGDNDDISSGGMERSPTLHEKLLSFYTKEGNVVLQMYVGCGLLARPGLRMGRHVLLLYRQESMEELQHLCNGTGTLPSCHAKRKLIVFDVNGVLLKRWRWESAPSHAANILHVGRMGVSLRPGILRLLRVVFELFNVGLWSSMQEQNLTPIINLIKSKYKEAGYGETFFKFCLHQGHCEERHCEGKHPKFNLVFVKNFRSELVASYIKDPLNTILVDENPEKAIENPPHTLVTVRSYDGASNNNVLLMNLLPYLEGLHAYPGLATDYIKNTPFKQDSAAHGGEVEHTMEATFGLGGDEVMAHPKM